MKIAMSNQYLIVSDDENTFIINEGQYIRVVTKGGQWTIVGKLIGFLWDSILIEVGEIGTDYKQIKIDSIADISTPILMHHCYLSVKGENDKIYKVEAGDHVQVGLKDRNIIGQITNIDKEYFNIHSKEEGKTESVRLETVKSLLPFEKRFVK